MDDHPWAPAAPGEHGYVAVGHTREKDFFKAGDCRHLFVGTGKQYHYCGWYKIVIDEPFAPDEWTLLPPSVWVSPLRTDSLAHP